MKRGLIFVLLLFVMLIGSVSAVAVKIPPETIIPEKGEIYRSITESTRSFIPNSASSQACGIVAPSTILLNPALIYGPMLFCNNDTFLDCQGATIIGGPFEDVITATDPTKPGPIPLLRNLTIQNCNIRGGYRGIVSWQFEDVVIRNNNVTGALNNGITIAGGSRINVTGNIIENVSNEGGYFSSGIGVYETSDLSISKNILMNNNRSGIEVSDDNCNVKIFDNILSNHFRKGINLMFNTREDCPIREIYNNDISGSGEGAIWIYMDSGTIVKNNTFSNNGWFDVGLYGYAYNSTKNVEIFDNVGTGGADWHGVYIDRHGGKFSTGYKSLENISVHDNSFSFGYQVGLFIRANGAVLPTIATNNTLNNNLVGVEIQDSANVFISQNKIQNNFVGIQHIGLTGKIYFYLNEIFNNALNIDMDQAAEVSYGGIGNYWGKVLPGPCFIPGIDSNALNVVDSHAYCGGPPNNIKIKFPTFGWYLFGSNLIPSNPTIETVLSPIAGSYDLVQSFVNGIGKQYKPGNPFNDLTGISPRNGYWIKITTAPQVDLVIVGNEVSPTSCYKLSLTPTPSPTSWVGYWASGIQPIGTALSSIDGSYSLVRTYENGAWTTYDPILPMFSDLDFMKPGQGYIITITNPDDLDYLGGFCPP